MHVHTTQQRGTNVRSTNTMTVKNFLERAIVYETYSISIMKLKAQRGPWSNTVMTVSTKRQGSGIMQCISWGCLYLVMWATVPGLLAFHPKCFNHSHAIKLILRNFLRGSISPVLLPNPHSTRKQKNFEICNGNCIHISGVLFLRTGGNMFYFANLKVFKMPSPVILKETF